MNKYKVINWFIENNLPILFEIANKTSSEIKQGTSIDFWLESIIGIEDPIAREELNTWIDCWFLIWEPNEITIHKFPNNTSLDMTLYKKYTSIEIRWGEGEFFVIAFN